MKNLLLILCICVMASCSGKGKSPPRNLDNACTIKSQRPSWYKTMKRAERKWGVPVHVYMAAIYQESKFVPDARTPHRYALGIIPMGRQSSAYGYAQAIDGTWKNYKRDQGKRGARRNNFADAVDFMGWYMNETHKRNGVSKHNAYGQYLAYHEGHAGYARGSYRSKPWLIKVAGRVNARANRYQSQLKTCTRRR